VSNPIDDYLAERPAQPRFEKRASMGSFLGPNFGSMAATSMREGAAQAIGQGAVGLAAAGIGIAAMKSYRALRKRRDFKEMLSVNPDLAEYQDQDPAKFNAHYNSLRTMNPGYAEDPIIAGTLMRRMSMHAPTAGSVLMESMESSSKMRPQQGPFTLGSKIGPMKDDPSRYTQETTSGLRF
jgi:hypothetical protein